MELSEQQTLKIEFDGSLQDTGIKKKNIIEKFFDWINRFLKGKTYC